MFRSLPTELTSCGKPLDLSPEAFGELKTTVDLAPESLRRGLNRDGYLFIPGFYRREEVLGARRDITDRLAEEGLLDERRPSIEAIAKQGLKMSFRPDLGNDSPALAGLIYSEQVMRFYEELLGGPVRHYDYTWLRAVAPGVGTNPHLDIVFMGRGTPKVMTAWTPLGDISLEVGGLIVLENSHRLTELQETYGRLDVDAVCENYQGQNLIGARGFLSSGGISKDPAELRQTHGGRWLTAEFHAGDLLTFGMFTVHASLDNRSQEVRLSSDSRCQLAAEPVDERWVGENPIGHGAAAKRSTIC
jgi:hypothetical protein